MRLLVKRIIDIGLHLHFRFNCSYVCYCNLNISSRSLKFCGNDRKIMPCPLLLSRGAHLAACNRIHALAPTNRSVHFQRQTVHGTGTSQNYSVQCLHSSCLGLALAFGCTSRGSAGAAVATPTSHGVLGHMGFVVFPTDDF